METTFARVVGITEPHRAPASQVPSGPRPAGHAADLLIDRWLVHPSLNMVTRDEVTVRLRSQLMDLLLCLASHPGKVFTKDELVTEVWEGRWVAPSAFSRCVAELRAALGDDAHRPHVIETITKRGYRLIARVEPVTSADTPPLRVSATAPSEAARGVHAHERDDAPPSLWQRLKLAARRPAWGFPSRA